MHLEWISILLAMSAVCASDIAVLDEIFGEETCIKGEIKIVDAIPTIIIKDEHVPVKTTTDYSKTALKPPESHLLLDLKQQIHLSKNALMLIHELAQYNDIQIEFILLEEAGEPHDKTFKLRMSLGNETYFGEEKSLKKAKTNAALKALQNTKYQHPKSKDEKTSESLTPTVLLNNLAAKLGMSVEYINENIDREINPQVYDYNKHNYYSLDQSTKSYMQKLNESAMAKIKVPKAKLDEDSPKSPFKIRLLVANQVFFGHGWTRQAAKHDAATNALKHLETMSTQDVESCLKAGDLCNKLATKSPVSLIGELAHQRNLELHFEVIGESGPAHKRTFVTLCTLGDMQTEAEGSSKKLSKKNAAIKMLEKLNKQDPIPLGSAIHVKNSVNKKKKNKKKKNNVQRATMKTNLINTMTDVYNFLSGEEDTKSKEDNKPDEQSEVQNNKNDLLNLAKQLGLNVKFATYSSGDLFSSIITLDAETSYICYGKDIKAEVAEDNASLNAIKFLKDVGLDNIIIPLRSDANHGGKIVINTVNNPQEEIVTA